jgi:undecaprenyl-phosphate galactose phosphotransferase
MYREVVRDLGRGQTYSLISLPTRSGVQLFLKRLIDVIISASALFLFAPVLSVIFLLVRRDGGPALYRQKRVGRDGKIFHCYKIRSMVMNSDSVLEELLKRDERAQREFQTYWKLANDPRITSLGYFLRKYSLDELPQLYNVLRGDMSIVGPRPRAVAEFQRTNFLVNGVDPYLSVRPGLTGLWQISGRNNIDLEGKVKLDSRYVETWSIRSDFLIILSTFRAVFLGEGAL